MIKPFAVNLVSNWPAKNDLRLIQMEGFNFGLFLVYMSCLFVCFFVWLVGWLVGWLFVSLFLCFFVCVFVSLFLCFFVRLFVSLFACLLACLLAFFGILNIFDPLPF